MSQSATESTAWIELYPSNVNLGLTLTAALGALGVLFLIDLPDWVRAAISTALLFATIADVYFVRMRHARAVVAFRLIDADASGAPPARAEGVANDAGTPKVLGIGLRYRGHRGGDTTAESQGVVLPRCYVSTYFTSIAYTLPDDPSWRRWFPRVLPLWADGIDAEQFRQVRVRLKWR